MVGKSILGQLLLNSSVWHGEVDPVSVGSGRSVASLEGGHITALAYTRNCTNNIIHIYLSPASTSSLAMRDSSLSEEVEKLVCVL